jgi:hypothetical protein
MNSAGELAAERGAFSPVDYSHEDENDLGIFSYNAGMI